MASITNNFNIVGRRENFRSFSLPSPQRHVLESDLFWSSIPSLENISALQKAKDGSIPVYLLPKTVVKKSEKKCLMRLNKMRITRIVTEMLGITHLAIPRARVYGKYLIEKRLPIQSTDQRWQTGFYLEHLRELDQAIYDFALLYSRMVLEDIISYRGDGNIRCDNAPFFVDEDGKYKIALVDLESAKFSPVSSIHEVFSTLAGFFPYHLDVIQKAFGLETPPSSALVAKEKGLQRIQTQYRDYLRFLEKNGVSIRAPHKCPHPSREQTQELIQEMIKKLKIGRHSDEIVEPLKVFIESLFSAIEDDFHLHLKNLASFKTPYDLFEDRFFCASLGSLNYPQSQIENLIRLTHGSFGVSSGDMIMSDIFNVLKKHDFIFSFKVIADLFQGCYFVEIEF